MTSPYLRLSLPFWLAICILAALGSATPNPLLTVVSILTLPIFATLLWRKGEPPILFFVVAFQWLEVTVKVFHSDYLGLTVEEMFGGQTINRAIELGLAGLFVLALGMRIGSARLPVLESVRMREQALSFSLSRIWISYVIATGASMIISRFVWTVPGLTQPLSHLAHFKWVMFFILLYAALLKKQGRSYVALALTFELILGFTGFFSKFNYSLFVFLLALVGVGYRPTPRNIVKATLLVSLGLVLCTVWMSVKTEFRDFISKGEKRQIIAMPFKARLFKMADLIGGLDLRSLTEGFELLIKRVAYVDIFAQVLEMVPEKIPHAEGQLWIRAIRHTVTPRLFFPDKLALGSDSELTMKYTGTYFAGEESGTSISMGYMAESYIDFGYRGMFVVIFLLGLLWGVIFKYFVTHSRITIFGYAMALTVLIDTLNFGSSNAKFFGGLTLGFMIMALISKLLVPLIYRWLLIRRA